MEGELVKQTRMRLGIARRMRESKQEIPHFYVQTEIVSDGILDGLEESANGGPRVSVTAVLVHGVARALAAHREFNSVWTDAGLLRADDINVGVAVAIDGGVLAPAIQAADRRHVGELNEMLRDLKARAAQGRLHPDEISGATFTLSNLGMFDVTAFVAIITPPQVAALAIGKPVERFVSSHGSVTSIKVMTATLSADHRVVDGVDAARFLSTFKQSLESREWLTKSRETGV